MEFCFRNGVKESIMPLEKAYLIWVFSETVDVCWWQCAGLLQAETASHSETSVSETIYIYKLCRNQNLYVWSKSRPRVLKVKGEEIQKSQMIVGLRGCLIHTRSWTSYRFISWRFMLDTPFPKISSSTMKNGSEAAIPEVQSLQANSFIHTFSKYLSNVCCEPGIILHFCSCGA